MKAAVIALSLAGLLLPGPLHADPIATLTCKSAGATTFTSSAYYFNTSNTSADLDLILDAKAYAALLSALGAGTTFSTCVLAGSAGSLTLADAAVNTVIFDAALPLTSTAPIHALSFPPNVAYTAATLSYSSISIAGDITGLRGKLAAAKPRPSGSSTITTSP